MPAQRQKEHARKGARRPGGHEKPAVRLQCPGGEIEPYSHVLVCPNPPPRITASTTVQHPANQAFQFAIRERHGVLLDAAFRNRGVQQ